ncbi:MAG: hypothetical protein RL696_702 [Actinomycetota bacterium]
MSGARQRLRPILMTALVTIFALTPMAMGLTGESGFISQPLAIVVIGGLFSSTILTLVLVPTLYWLIEGRKERKKIRLERKAQRAKAKAEKKAAKTAGKEPKQAKTTEPVAPAPAMVVPATAEAKPEPVEVSEEALATAIEQSFTPAVSQEAPAMSWSLSQDDVELDSEATMKWQETSTDTSPIAAIKPEESLEFLTQENPVVTSSKQDEKARRKAEKAELKAQKKAAKNSRHAGD